MTTADYSAIAAAVSAACAFFTLYMFRSRSRGFVWTKDHVLSVLADKECRIHMQARIPLFNLGKGNIKFISLRAKKINIKTKAMENFEIDMDEAYFPEKQASSLIKPPFILKWRLMRKRSSSFLAAVKLQRSNQRAKISRQNQSEVKRNT